MPSQAANRAALRSDGTKIRAYAAFFTGAAVLSGEILLTLADYPAANLVYSALSGSHTAVRRGYRVVVRTSGGGYKATLTVRASGTIASNSLPVREFSRGTLDLVAGDVFTVYSVMQPGDKLVEATAAFAPDGLAYAAQNEDFPPLTCSGFPFAGMVDAGQTYATILTTGTNSSSLVGGSLTHLWTLVTGVTFTPGSSSTDANPTLRATQGEYLIEHTVTDATTGASWTQYPQIKVFDAAHPPYDVLFDSAPGTVENGFTCTLELFANATLTDIPDDTLCVIFLKQTINGIQQSFGSAFNGRSHLLMAGFTRRDTIEYDDGLDTLRMEVVSPLARYVEILGLSKVGLRIASPADWSGIAGLTTWRMVVQILRWYTWLTESFDLLLHSGLEDFDFPALFLQELDAIGQARELVRGLSGRFVCLRTGAMEAQPRLELTDPDDRGNFPTTLIAGDPDILGFSFERSHLRTVKLVRTRGFLAGTTDAESLPVFAKWTGAAPGFGNMAVTEEKLIVASTEAHYALNGRYGADNERLYLNPDGVALTAPTGTLRLPGYFIFDFYAEWLEFDPALAANLRDVTLSDFRWIITGITYGLDERGAGETVLQLKAETNGSAGTDDTPAPEGDTGLGGIDWELPEWEVGPPLPPGSTPGMVFGRDRLAVIRDDGFVSRTFNLDYASPTFDAIDLTGTYVGNPKQWCFDARSGGGDSLGWVVDDAAGGSGGGIYKLSSLFAATPVLTPQPNALAASVYRNIDFSFGAGGPGLFGIVASYYASGETVKVSLTRDGGQHWSAETTLSTGKQAATTPQVPGCLINSRSGDAYVCAFGGGDVYTLWKLPAGAVAWTQISTISDDDDLMALITMAFADPAGAYLYHGWLDIDLTENKLLRAALPSTAGVDISPTAAAVPYGPDHARGRFTMAISFTNRNRALLCGLNGAGTARGVWTTADLEAATPTWTQRVAPTGAVNYVRGALIDDSRLLLWGTNLALAFSADFGATIVSKAGNLSGSAEILGVTG